MTDVINVLSPLVTVQDANGDPVANGSIEFYVAGTSTPKTVYADRDLTTALGTTVATDSAGYPITGGSARTLIYTGVGDFKMIVKNSLGATLVTHDNVPGAVATVVTSEFALPETPVISKTSNYTVTTADQGKIINCNPTGGSFAITLLSGVTAGDGFRITVRHSANSSNVVTIRTTGGETIGIPGKSATSFSLKGWGAATSIVSDGASWVVDSEVQPAVLDGIPYLKITDRLTTPPTSPVGGARYIINGSPAGAWSTLGFAANQIAESDGNGSWFAYTPASGWFAYVADEDLFTKYDGSSWEDQTGMGAPSSSTLQCAVFEDQKANGTAGGTAATGAWTTRTINTSVSNTITGVSLASNQITLPVGTYLLNFWGAMRLTAGQHRIKVISGTATPDPIVSGYHNGAAADSAGHTPGTHAPPASTSAVITVTATAVIELQYYAVTASGGTDGLGQASVSDPASLSEVYSRVTILSLAALQGPQGIQGTQGVDGIDAGYAYAWSTLTSGDPGSGKIAGNSGTISSITQLQVSETDANGVSLAAVIATWDDSTSSTKARITITKEGTSGGANKHIFSLTGAGTDQGTYWTFPVTYVSTAGTISNGDSVAVLVLEKGDKGDTGATGATGAAGATGPAGSATSNSTFILNGIITPSQITADQNNYNPTGFSTCSTIRLSSDASRNITGLTAGSDGQVIILHNAGAQNITLKDESASSSAANRFALAGDALMPPDAVAVLQYDATSSRWRAVSGGGSANPISDDGQALGTTSLKWSDLFLAAGGVINWNAGAVTLTESSDALAFAGADAGYTFTHSGATNIAGIRTTHAGSGFVWSNSNTSYVGSLGTLSANGSPFLAFHAEHSSTANTLQNSGAGVKGMYLLYDGTNLDFIFNGVATANAAFSSSVTGLRMTTAGAATLPNLLTITQATANTGILASTGYSLTGTNATSMIDLAGTWNTTGTPTAIKLDITDTASNGSSLLMDLRVGGSSMGSLTKAGRFVAASGYMNSSTSGILPSGNTLHFYAAAGQIGRFLSTGELQIDYGPITVSGDVKLNRDAANTHAWRNGTSAQTSRIYGTYTDASNYRRVAIAMTTAGVASIAPEGAGTGASGNVLHISGLPTSNPGPGILWNNAGTPAIGT